MAIVSKGSCSKILVGRHREESPKQTKITGCVAKASLLVGELAADGFKTPDIFRQQRIQSLCKKDPKHVADRKKALELKKSLSELPGKLVPRRLTEKLLSAMKEDGRSQKMKEAIAEQLPFQSAVLLSDLLGLLRSVVAHQEKNHMDDHKVSTVLSPILFDFTAHALQDAETTRLLSFMIFHKDEILAPLNAVRPKRLSLPLKLGALKKKQMGRRRQTMMVGGDQPKVKERRDDVTTVDTTTSEIQLSPLHTPKAVRESLLVNLPASQLLWHESPVSVRTAYFEKKNSKQ